jgi:hypothetical protein
MQAPASSPELPGELLAKLLRLTGLGTILAARRAARHMRSPAAELVEGLQAVDGQLPAEAWRAFPLATRLTAKEGQEWSSAADYFSNLVELMGTLPRQRLERLTIGAPDVQQWTDGCDTPRLARALLASPCAPTLAQLDLQAPILPAAADLLLGGGLPALERVSICTFVGWQELAAAPVEDDGLLLWRPTTQLAGPQPALHLQWHDPHTNCDIILDLSGLGTELRALSFSGFFFRELPVVSRLTRLERLSISLPPRANWDTVEEDEDGADELEALLPLHSLRELLLPEGEISASMWPRLAAALPQLHTLSLRSLVACVGAPPAAELTSLSVLGPGIQGGLYFSGLQGEHPEPGGLQGLLSRQLPRLQQLNATTWELPELAAALQGHLELQRLELRAMPVEEQVEGLAPWPEEAAPAGAVRLGQMAASMPALRELRLSGCFICDDSLLRDLAGCNGLRRLALDSDTPHGPVGAGISAAGLAALAEGACASSLERLELLAREGVDVEAVAELLKGGRAPALRQVTVRVLVEGGGGAPAERLRLALPGLLAQRAGEAVLGRLLVCSCEVVREGGSGGVLVDCTLRLG